MITDEQIIEALTAYLLDGYGARSLKESMRKALEAYEQSKWVKFDVDDESTYPQRTGHHIAFDGCKVSHKYWDNTGDNTMEDKRIRNNSWFVSGSVNFKKVTHWQPLPEFKELIMTDKDKARRTRMRFEIETAISNGGSVEDLEKAVDRIIAIHEANKPKPEPVGYAWVVNNRVKMIADTELNSGFRPIYTAPPTREPLSDDEMPVGRVMVNGVLLSPDCTTAFILGVRFAEQKHGIGV